MSEGKLNAAMSRGARAEALLRNELLQEAFQKLEDGYVAAWKTWGCRHRGPRAAMAGGQRAGQGARPSRPRPRRRQARAARIQRSDSQAAIVEETSCLN